MPEGNVAALLAQWFNVPTWQESQSFLTAHPQLCSGDAENILRNQLARQRDPALIGVLDDHLALLIRCRAEGVADAYGWWTGLIARARRHEAEAEEAERRYDEDKDAGALDAAVRARLELAGLFEPLSAHRSGSAQHSLARLLAGAVSRGPAAR